MSRPAALAFDALLVGWALVIVGSWVLEDLEDFVRRNNHVRT